VRSRSSTCVSLTSSRDRWGVFPKSYAFHAVSRRGTPLNSRSSLCDRVHLSVVICDTLACGLSLTLERQIDAAKGSSCAKHGHRSTVKRLRSAKIEEALL
jgi:hypothetical protein